MFGTGQAHNPDTAGGSCSYNLDGKLVTLSNIDHGLGAG